MNKTDLASEVAKKTSLSKAKAWEAIKSLSAKLGVQPGDLASYLEANWDSLDSLDIVEMVMGLEELMEITGVEIDAAKMEVFKEFVLLLIRLLDK